MDILCTFLLCCNARNAKERSRFSFSARKVGIYINFCPTTSEKFDLTWPIFFCRIHKKKIVVPLPFLSILKAAVGKIKKVGTNFSPRVNGSSTGIFKPCTFQ